MPASVAYASGIATLTPDAPLAYATDYTATVSGSVADLAGNPLGANASWTFTTADAPVSTLTDTTVADFGAGTTAAHLCQPTPPMARSSWPPPSAPSSTGAACPPAGRQAAGRVAGRLRFPVAS